MNRKYVTDEEVARSMYRRRKEHGFTTEELSLCHKHFRGPGALAWAREKIKRMLRKKIITSTPDTTEQYGDKRRKLYGFTEEALTQWRLEK